MTASLRAARLHHVGIQTDDFDNCVAWYTEMLGCRTAWTLDGFSPTTLSRLPGIVRLAELTVDGLRLHVFERSGDLPDLRPSRTQFQHVCIEVTERSDLDLLQDRWWSLFLSGRFIFARPPGEPTAIETSDTGTSGFYALDVNGLELEFVHEERPLP